jgi:hypothetical protein
MGNAKEMVQHRLTLAFPIINPWLSYIGGRKAFKN